jgi:hypothetical protein
MLAFIVRPARLNVSMTSSPGSIDEKRRAPSLVRIEIPSMCVITSPR